jgi:LysM repeat protein
MNWRRLLVYLFLNAIVSASVTLTVLYAWDLTHPAGVVQGPVTATPHTVSAGTQGAATVAPGVTVTPTLYEVKGGDTLGSIALQFDVSIEEIMQANGLTDPNALNVGQQLVIPVSGVVLPPATQAPAGPSPTSVTPPPTSTALPEDSEPQLAIRAVNDAGSLSAERVTVVNLGGVVDLAGWLLRDGEGNTYAFPALSLFQGGAVNVHTALGRDTVTDLYWGQAAAVWQSGETASLIDPQGRTHTTFNVP